MEGQDGFLPGMGLAEIQLHLVRAMENPGRDEDQFLDDCLEDQLRHAEETLADGTYGSERWREHHQASVKRLRELYRVLVDPAIPEGALIRTLNADEFSPIQMAIQDRLGNSPLAAADELRGLLPTLSGGK